MNIQQFSTVDGKQNPPLANTKGWHNEKCENRNLLTKTKAPDCPDQLPPSWEMCKTRDLLTKNKIPKLTDQVSAPGKVHKSKLVDQKQSPYIAKSKTHHYGNVETVS